MQSVTWVFTTAVIQVILPGSVQVMFFVATMQFLIITPGLFPEKFSKFAPRIPPTAE